ncbi:hypothetical protein RhiirC2_770218 [Rhizophagus irregularis]|uniref:Uncharacterized protein n=1 Tax=Rhizophagus irregularis TaxID=588596 RepID=A0A2N1NX66_9GLOM|nr:hypothetical protein RhiirC2_770218 [Rhizophagus irregularis]
MAYDNNNQLLVDYLKVKQHINNLRDSSFLDFLKVGLKEYAANNISEKHIVDTVKLTVGEDLASYEALLSEYREVFKNALINMEIYAYPEPQLQLQQLIVQIESEVDQMENEPSISISPKTLKADAIAFTPKEKGRKRVFYADAVKQDLNSDSRRLSLLSPKMDKKMKKLHPF